MTYDATFQQRARFIDEFFPADQLQYLAVFGGDAVIVKAEVVPLAGHPLDFQVTTELAPKFIRPIMILNEAVQRIVDVGIGATGLMRFQLAAAAALPSNVLGAVVECLRHCRASDSQVAEFFGAVQTGVGVIAKSRRVLRSPEIERIRWETIIDVQQRLAYGGCQALAA